MPRFSILAYSFTSVKGRESAPVRRRKFFLVARAASPGSPRVTAVVTGRKTGLWSGSFATILQKQVEFATIDLWSSSETPTQPRPVREGK
jgi:hypothetical protein